MSNEAIGLKLEHLSNNVDNMRSQLVSELQLLRVESVRRDLYEEQRRADLKEIEDIKEKQKASDSRKWMMWLAVATAAFALGRDLLVSIIQQAGP